MKPRKTYRNIRLKGDEAEWLDISPAIHTQQRVFSLLQLLGHTMYKQHPDYDLFMERYNVTQEDVDLNIEEYIKLINQTGHKS